MKKNSIFIILLFAVQMLDAQVSYGIKSGVNLSTIREKNIDYDFKTGFYAGGFANIKFAEKFAFQPEVLFAIQGAKKDNLELTEIIGNEVVTTAGIDVENKLYYLNIPLMFKYYFIKKLNFEVGPQVGFVLKNEITTKSDELGEDSGEPDSNIDLGVNIGLEYNLYQGLGVGVRYNTGLTKIVKDSEHKNSNSVISFGLSYSFN